MTLLMFNIEYEKIQKDNAALTSQNEFEMQPKMNQENEPKMQNKIEFQSDKDISEYEPKIDILDEAKMLHACNPEQDANKPTETAAPTLGFSTDPATWDAKNEALIDYLASIKFPDRNISDRFPESVREYPDKVRQLSKNLFQSKLPNGEVVDRDWMIYSKSKGSIFCFKCFLFAKKETQFSSLDGFNDWKNASTAVRQHESNVIPGGHKDACSMWSCRINERVRIDQEILSQYQMECEYWRNVLKRLIPTIKFLASRGLAFAGVNEDCGSSQNGNYLGMLEYLSEFDLFMKNHLEQYGKKGKGNTSYLSRNICDELIQVMANKVITIIIEEVKKSKYYSISVDSTPDISHTDQLTFILRYITEAGKPIERFVEFIEIHDHGAEKLATTVLNILQKLTLDIHDCRGQTYDNAYNMAGKYSGLQQRIKNLNPLAEFVPCAAHSLNLVGQSAAECCTSAITFFGFLQKLYNFFSASTYRWGVLSKSLSKNVPVPKNLAVTRWSARADATKALYKGYENIKQALEFIKKDECQTNATKQDASSLIVQMEKFETALMTTIWNTILERFNSCNKLLQSATMILSSAVRLYDSLKDFLLELKDTSAYDNFQNSAAKLTECSNYNDDLKRQRKRKKFFDETNDLDEIENQSTSGREKFRNNTYNVIVDTLISALEKRRSAYDKLDNVFGFLYDVTKMSSADLRLSALKLIECYPNDLEDVFPDELLHFASYVKKRDNQCPQMYLQLLREENLRSTYPNVDIALRMFLCNFATNCTGERSFSALSRISNERRSTISHKKMSALSLLCIESELVSSMSFDDIINDFAELKARKKPL